MSRFYNGDRRDFFVSLATVVVWIVLFATIVAACAYVTNEMRYHQPSHEGCQALTGSDSSGDRVTVYLCPTPTPKETPHG